MFVETKDSKFEKRIGSFLFTNKEHATLGDEYSGRAFSVKKKTLYNAFAPKASMPPFGISTLTFGEIL